MSYLKSLSIIFEHFIREGFNPSENPKKKDIITNLHFY